MTERPRTLRIAKSADVPGWVGIALVAIGGLFGAYASYHQGVTQSAVLQSEVQHLAQEVESMKSEVRDLRDRVITLESTRRKYRR